MSNVPKTIIETETLPEGVTYTIMRQEQSEASLKKERERLLERIAEIDEELKRLASYWFSVVSDIIILIRKLK